MSMRERSIVIFVISILVKIACSQNETTKRTLNNSITEYMTTELIGFNLTTEEVWKGFTFNITTNRHKRNSKKRKKTHHRDTQDETQVETQDETQDDYNVRYETKFAFQNVDDEGLQVKYNKTEHVYYGQPNYNGQQQPATRPPQVTTLPTTTTPTTTTATPTSIATAIPSPPSQPLTTQSAEQSFDTAVIIRMAKTSNRPTYHPTFRNNEIDSQKCWDKEGRRKAQNEIISIKGECRTEICRGHNIWAPYQRCIHLPCDVDYKKPFPQCCTCPPDDAQDKKQHRNHHHHHVHSPDHKHKTTFIPITQI